jgi:hypothetical protein
MECTSYRPRLSIELSCEQQRKLQMYFPHGMIKVVFSQVVDDLIDLIERYGAGVVLGAYIQREVKLEDLSGNLKEFKKVDLGDGVS